MRKLKLLFTGLAFLGGVFSANAQTDVTSTYLTNADFSEGPVMTVSIHTYNKDKTGSNVAQMQAVEGWTIVNNGDARASGVFTYGDGLFVGGDTYYTPSADPNGNASGNTLGMVAVWQADLQYTQNVSSSLPAGHYTLTFPVYNSKGGTVAINANYFGFIEDNGKTHYASEKTFSVNAWTTMTVSFDLSVATSGKISVGYKSTNSGSGSMPHLFLDNVTINYTDPLQAAKDALQEEIDKAKLCDAKEGLADAIAAAEAALASATTEDELAEALATLQAADKDAVLRYENGLADATYSDPIVTDFVVNGTFDNGINPWQRTGGFQNNQTANNKQGAFTGNFYENWDGTAKVNKMYQTINNIPNGTYRLDIAAFVNNLADPNESQYVFANDDKTYLTTGEPTAYEVWTVVTNNTIEIGLEQTTATANWMGIDNVSLRYYGAGDVVNDAKNASHELAWLEAKAAAEAAIDDEAYENVTGSERTALEAEIAKAEPTTAEGYDEAAAALNAATATFTAAKAAYDGLASLWSAGVPELIYATTEKYTAIGDAYFGEGEVVDAADAAARTAAMRTAIRAYYESHALAEKVEGAVNCADAIAGADPDVNTGWINGIGVDERTQEKYTDASGNPCGKYYDGGWSDKAGVNINMSRSIEIPAGRYLLTVTARGSENLTSYTLSIGEDDVDLPKNGSGVDKGVFGHGWDDVSLEFESDGHPVTLTIAATSTDYYQWISFNRFRLMRLELNTDAYAGATEYAALNDAIETAEAKNLGFEDGQYAPYNNVEALEALAAAKAIDQTAELTNLKADVEAVTEALADATWTANDGDVAIVYNGTFAETGVGNNPKGWTRSNNGWGQQITGLTAEANGVDAGTTTAWYYNNNGAWEYGKDEIYKMPLAADTKYVLSFKYRKHGSDSQSWMKASVVNDSEEGLDVVQYPGAESNTIFQSAKAYFTTGAAGNYILRIEQNGNAHLTDVSIEKASSTTMDISENSTTIPELAFYETVSLTRTIKANDTWNTFVVPFDIDNDELKAKFGDDVAVAEYSEEADGEKSTVSFNTMATPAITANKPVLLKTSTAGTSYEFTGKLIKTGEAKVEGINFDFVGSYDATFTIPELDYFISDNKLWRAEENKTTIKGTRAYIHDMNPGNARIVNFFIDGQETTGISTIATLKANNAAYDMQGRRVETLKKGVYVVNGKKVVVK